MSDENIPNCPECQRAQNLYQATADRLLAAQRELASYNVSRDGGAFDPAWKACESALRELWKLREEMALHVNSHVTG